MASLNTSSNCSQYVLLGYIIVSRYDKYSYESTQLFDFCFKRVVSFIPLCIQCVELYVGGNDSHNDANDELQMSCLMV